MTTLFKNDLKVELDEIKSVNLDGRESISVLVKQYICLDKVKLKPWLFTNQYVCTYCRMEDLARIFIGKLGYYKGE